MYDVYEYLILIWYYLKKKKSENLSMWQQIRFFSSKNSVHNLFVHPELIKTTI